MERKYGFTKMTLPEFGSWLKEVRVSRTIVQIQQHHTYIPSYIHFDGTNHFERQQAMKNHHVNSNGWADIGQHITVFPDGTILSGRSMERAPACILGHNANAICVENLGNFDAGGDAMTSEQKESIIAVTALLCEKFNIPVSTDYVVYHHWFSLSTGARNNGSGNNKSCPGTQFFGGNKVPHCQNHFLPLIQTALSGSVKTDLSAVEKFVCVTANSLRVRTEPNASSALAAERAAVTLGAILRVYEEKDGWLKISNSDSRWISARYTIDVQRAVVTASVLNVRSGPAASYPRAARLSRGELVFISETHNSWCKIALEEQWVSKRYLQF